MTIKLSDYKRGKIRAAILDGRFKKADESHLADMQQLGRKVYYQAFSVSDRRKMRSLPDGWLPKVKEFGARLGTDDVFFEYAEDGAVPVPFEKYDRYGAPVILALPPEDALSQIWKGIQSRKRARDEEENNLTREINAVLYSATTAKKLVETWPEIASIVEGVCETPTINLPAPRVDALNQMLGLGAKVA
jgi:hypothetical protein